MEQAHDADRMFDVGTAPRPLCGVPVAVKDIINTNGIATSCGTASLWNGKPDYDAAVVEYLRQAVAVLMGNLATFAFAISSHPEMPQSNNPWGRGDWFGRILEWVGRGHRCGPVLWRHRNGLRWLHRIPSAITVLPARNRAIVV